MTRKLLAIVCVVVIFAGVVATYAGGGYSFSAKGGSLHIDGYGVGLGPVDGGTVRAAATLSGYLLCANNGGNTAPGQKPFVTNVQGSGPATADSNGKVYFKIDVSDDAFGYFNISAKQAGCPNNNWKVIDYIHYSMVLTLSAYDSSGQLQKNTSVTYNCLANPPGITTDYVCTQA